MFKQAMHCTAIMICLDTGKKQSKEMDDCGHASHVSFLSFVYVSYKTAGSFSLN